MKGNEQADSRVGKLKLKEFQFNNGEFDPGSGSTLAACLIHASRTRSHGLAHGFEWRTGE